MNRSILLGVACAALTAFSQNVHAQSASGKWCGSAAGYNHVMTLNVRADGATSGSLLVNQQNTYRVSGTIKAGAVNLRPGAANLTAKFTGSGIQGSFCWGGGCAPIAYSRC